MTASKRLASQLLAPLAVAFCVAAPVHLAVAQAPVHHSWVHRHPTATGVVAAIATHHALKVAARNAKLHGKKLNWAERHPSISAFGAGIAVHHMAKHHIQ